jgi:hypothetical protein
MTDKGKEFNISDEVQADASLRFKMRSGKLPRHLREDPDQALAEREPDELYEPLTSDAAIVIDISKPDVTQDES